MIEPGAPAEPIRCPLCGAAGTDPIWHAGRWRWTVHHADDCRLARILRLVGTTPRDEVDYLDGAAAPFEPSDLIERGHTR